MRRPKVVIPLVVLAILLAIGLAVLLRQAAPPEPVRLLPGAQAYFYVNLSPLRRADVKLGNVQLDPDYEQFVKETGFEFERDLNEMATAVHTGGNNGENRYTHIFVAHFDSDKIRRYFNKLSSRVDSYKDVEVFNVPHEGRTVRIAILGPDMVTVSNVDDPLVIRGVIDRSKKLASPFGGPALVRHYYRKLPFGTLAWAIADIARGSNQNKAFVVPGGFDLFFPPDSVAVASVRYLGAIDFKVEVLTKSEDDAKHVTEQVSAFLALFHSLETNASGSDPDVKTFFDSLKMEQSGSNAVLTAELPKGFIKKLLTEPPPEPQVAAPPPEPPKQPAKPRHKRRR